MSADTGILAIIQARMHSTRLPGKSMLELAGVPLIEHVVKRVQAAELVTQVVVATTNTPADDPLAAHVESLGCRVYRGSDEDVLGRCYWAAEAFPHSDPIVRITADDPYKDPRLIDYALTGFLGEWAQLTELGGPQYMHLGGVTWPLGCDVEVFTRDALAAAQAEAFRPDEREHVTPWMRRMFKTWVVKNPRPDARYTITRRWTIDTIEDYSNALKMYEALYHSDPLFGYRAIVEAGL